jgi:putative bacteriocin precursor
MKKLNKRNNGLKETIEMYGCTCTCNERTSSYNGMAQGSGNW